MTQPAEKDAGKWWIGNDDRDPLLSVEKDTATVERVKALVDAWSDPQWSGRDAAAPFVRALRNALNYPTPTSAVRVLPPVETEEKTDA